MAGYLAEYRDELREAGAARFVQLHPYPVLIVRGLSGTIKGQRAAGGTAVSQNSEVVLLGSIVGRVFPLVKNRYSAPGPLSIGRTDDNDVVIPEYSISRRHCLVAIVGSDVLLADCGSTNGTVIDGVRLESRRTVALAEGQVVHIGRFALVFHRSRGFAAYLEQST